MGSTFILYRKENFSIRKIKNLKLVGKIYMLCIAEDSQIKIQPDYKMKIK